MSNSFTEIRPGKNKGRWICANCDALVRPYLDHFCRTCHCHFDEYPPIDCSTATPAINDTLGDKVLAEAADESFRELDFYHE